MRELRGMFRSDRPFLRLLELFSRSIRCPGTQHQQIVQKPSCNRSPSNHDIKLNRDIKTAPLLSLVDLVFSLYTIYIRSKIFQNGVVKKASHSS